MRSFWIIIFSFVVSFSYSQTTFRELIHGPENNEFSDYTSMFSIDLFTDVHTRSFKEFEPIIGDYTIDALHPYVYSLNLGYSYSHKNFLSYIHFGWANNFTKENDSLHFENKDRNLSVGMGMEFFFNNFHVAPQLGLRYQYSKLKTNTKTSTIDDYNLLMEFNQFYAFEGIRLGYRLYSADTWFSEFIIIGAYFNYMIPLHKYPFVKQDGSWKNYEYGIQTDALNWGIYFSFATGY